MSVTELIVNSVTNITCTWSISSRDLIKDPEEIYDSIAKSKFVTNGKCLWSAYFTLRKNDTHFNMSIKINKKWLRENSVYINAFEIATNKSNLINTLKLAEPGTKTKVNVIQHFVTRSSIYGLFEDPLIITFRVNLISDQMEKRKVSPTNGLECIFNNKQFSDIKVVVGSEEFYLYKGILASESRVFAAMFEHDMKEKKENIVEISDIDHELAKAMFYFMYTGKVNNIEDVATELLSVADKYEINNLKICCEETLIDSLEVDNVTSLLILSDKYSAEQLRKRSVLFFKLNVHKIIKNENYKANFKSLLPVLQEIIEILVQQLN